MIGEAIDDSRERKNSTRVVPGVAHKMGCEMIVLVQCIQCRVVDMTLDSPSIRY